MGTNNGKRSFFLITAFLFFLALYSYSQRSFSFTLPTYPNYVAAKSSSTPTYKGICTGYSGVQIGTNYELSTCMEAAKATFTPNSNVVTLNWIESWYTQYSDYRLTAETYTDTGAHGYTSVGRLYSITQSSGYECPPDDAPDYKKGPTSYTDGTTTVDNVCLPQFTLCPAGYYHYETNGTCVAITCPSSGTQVDNIKDFNLKWIYGTSGTYCDGTCAYSVGAQAKSTAGDQFMKGVSLGAVCGYGPSDSQQYYAQGNENDVCSTGAVTDTGATYITCQSTGDSTNTEVQGVGQTPVDISDNQVQDTTLPTTTNPECTTSGDSITCIGNQITAAVENSTQQEDNAANARHNALIQAQQDITNFLDQQQAARQAQSNNNSAAIVSGLSGIQTAISGSGNAGIISAINGVGDGLNKTETETDGEPTSGLQGFYESEYPNGFQDVWNNNKTLFQQTEMYQFLEQWKVTVSGGAPSMEFCFNLGGSMNYGCDTVAIDPRVFPFLYVITMICMAFLCRSLIFGG